MKRNIVESLKAELQADLVEFEHSLALIMVVGEGMRQNVGTTARASQAPSKGRGKY